MNWPKNKNSAEEVYEENEKGGDGFYPVGINNFWHSGIHIPFNVDIFNDSAPVKPLFEGKLVAFRISEDYIEIQRPEFLSENAYANLVSSEKALYDKDIKNEVLRYKLIDKEGAPPQYYSNNFVLIRHSLTLPGEDEKKIDFFTLYMNLLPDSAYFLTKYYSEDFNSLQLIPGKAGVPENYYLETQPFYRSWEFKADPVWNEPNFYYKQKGILPLSWCELRNADIFYRDFSNNEYLCRFINGDKEIDVSRDDLEILDPIIIIKPNKKDVPFFRAETPNYEQSEGHKIAVLKEGETFQVVEDGRTTGNWAFDQNYIQIRLNQSKIDQDKTFLRGWIYKPAFKINTYGSLKLFQFTNESIPETVGCKYRDFYQLEEYVPARHGRDLYKIVRFRTYLQYVTGRSYYFPIYEKIEQKGNIVTKIIHLNKKMNNSDVDAVSSAASLIQDVPESDNRIILLFNREAYQRFDPNVYHSLSFDFYFAGDAIDVIKVDSETFNQLADESTGLQSQIAVSLTQNLKVLAVTKAFNLFSNEEVKEIITPSECSTFNNKQKNWVYCRYYVDRYTDSSRLVHADDFELVTGPKARIKEKIRIVNSDQLIDAEDGLILYDTPGIEGNSSFDNVGNASSILPIDSVMKLRNPEKMIYNFSRGFYHITANNGSEDVSKYIYLKNQEQLLGKTVLAEGFEIGDAIIAPNNIDVTFRSILGYPGKDDDGSKRYYDLSLFFNDDTFLDEVVPGREVLRYVIPPEQVLKEEIANPIDFIQYFPANTEFDIITSEELNGQCVYHLELKAMDVYLSTRSFTDELTAAEKIGHQGNDLCKINNVPDKLWLLGMSIRYTEPREEGEEETIITCDQKARPFALAFNRIRDKFKDKVINRLARGDGGDKFRLDFSDPDLTIDLKFWTFPSDDIRIEGQTVKTIGAAKTFSGYSSNPLECELSELSRETDLAGSLYLWDPVTARKCRVTKEVYLGFNFGDKIVYVSKTSADGFKKNLLEWKEFFNIVEEDSATSGDLFCDIKETVLDKIEINQGDELRVTDPDGRLTRNELAMIFQRRHLPYNRNIIEQLRKLVCKHPLEWDKSLYDDIGTLLIEKLGPGFTEPQVKVLTECGNKLDLWEGIKGVDGMSGENSHWFTHPVYFCEHLERSGMLEVNPFLDKNIYRYSNMKGVDNPGFAPVATEKTDVIYHGKYILQATGHFNADFKTANKGRKEGDFAYYFHEGVDFWAPIGTEIISFVFGTVIGSKLSKKWSNERNMEIGMGGCLVIQNDINKDIHYVLVHLDNWEMVKAGDKIMPGMIVATVGQDISKDALPHLHLTKVIQNNGEPVVFNGNSFPWWAWNLSPNNQDHANILNCVVNPFNHEEVWKGRWKN